MSTRPRYTWRFYKEKWPFAIARLLCMIAIPIVYVRAYTPGNTLFLVVFFGVTLAIAVILPPVIGREKVREKEEQASEREEKQPTSSM